MINGQVKSAVNFITGCLPESTQVFLAVKRIKKSSQMARNPNQISKDLRELLYEILCRITTCVFYQKNSKAPCSNILLNLSNFIG